MKKKELKKLSLEELQKKLDELYKALITAEANKRKALRKIISRIYNYIYLKRKGEMA